LLRILPGLTRWALLSGVLESDLLYKLLQRIFIDAATPMLNDKIHLSLWTDFIGWINPRSTARNTVLHGLLHVLVSTEISNHKWPENESLRLKVAIHIHRLIFRSGEFDPATLRAILHWLLVSSPRRPSNGIDSQPQGTSVDGDLGEVNLDITETPSEDRGREGLRDEEGGRERYAETSAVDAPQEETEEMIENELHGFLSDQLGESQPFALQAFEVCCAFILERPILGLSASVLGVFVTTTKNFGWNLTVQDSMDQSFRHLLLPGLREDGSKYSVTQEYQEHTLVTLVETVFNRILCCPYEARWESMLSEWFGLIGEPSSSLSGSTTTDPGGDKVEADHILSDSGPLELEYLREYLKSKLDILQAPANSC
jgi:hypothetical protein